MPPPATEGDNTSTSQDGPQMPLKQKVTMSFRSLLDSARKLAIGDAAGPADKEKDKASLETLFPKVSKAVDGDDCDHDCESCSVKYPARFKIEEDDLLYGHVKPWSTHVLVATGKSDWVRDVKDEKGSIMQAIGHAKAPNNGKLMLSASNIPTPHHSSDYAEPTTVLLLPAFTIIENVTPATVGTLISDFIEKAPTTTSPLAPVRLPRALPAPLPEASPAALKELTSRACPHAALILLCSQKTRDARCGQSAPLLRKELQRHLHPLGLWRDLDDERPGGVAVYFISHTGGHKYSANVLVYRRPDAFGVDQVRRAEVLGRGEEVVPVKKNNMNNNNKGEAEEEEEEEDGGAAQCIWLARVKPEDCEGIVKFTVLQGKVIKPERQLRGGFDRARGLVSW